MHIPVLRDAVIAALIPLNEQPPSEQPTIQHVIDGTLGAGGHTAALLDAGAGEVLGLDRDPMAIQIASDNLAPYGDRVHIKHASYTDMREQAALLGWDSVDAILMDLGVSSMQLDTPDRGFAFRHEGALDMRFDPTDVGMTAADLVNTLEESELADIFYQYGEERDSRRIARAVVRQRPYQTTKELADVIAKAARHDHKEKIHPATRAFQALRIAVNDELNVVESMIPTALDLLKPGGRLAIISFHSLEDRIVKEAFKLAATDCICPPKVPICVCGHEASVKLITRKPLIADEAEIAQNPRSRSAKLRVAEKL